MTDILYKPVFGRLFASISTNYMVTSTLPATTTPILFTCWIKMTSLASARAFMTIGTAGSNNTRWTLGINSSNQIVANARTTSDAVATTTGAIPVAGRWNFCAAYFQGISSRYSYLDEEISAQSTTSRNISGVDEFTLGRNPNSAQLHNGVIAEPCVWVPTDKVEADAIVRALYQGQDPRSLIHGKPAAIFQWEGTQQFEADKIGGRIILTNSVTDGGSLPVLGPMWLRRPLYVPDIAGIAGSGPQNLTFTPPALQWAVGGSTLASTTTLAGTAPSIQWTVGTSSLVAAASISGTAPELQWIVGASTLVSAASITGTSPFVTWTVAAATMAAEASLAGTAPSVQWAFGTPTLVEDAGPQSLDVSAPALTWSITAASLVAAATLSGSSPSVTWQVASSSLDSGALIVSAPSVAWEVGASQLAGEAALLATAPGVRWGVGEATLVVPPDALVFHAPFVRWNSNKENVYVADLQNILFGTAPSLRWRVASGVSLRRPTSGALLKVRRRSVLT